MLAQALRLVNLKHQPRESMCPPLLQEMAQRYLDMVIPRAKEGVRILGFPVGTESFVWASLTKIKDSIVNELPTLARLDDGLIHFQMLRLCANTRLPYFMRGVATEASMAHAKAVDRALWDARLGSILRLRRGLCGHCTIH
jgi:hypothetical protein